MKSTCANCGMKLLSRNMARHQKSIKCKQTVKAVKPVKVVKSGKLIKERQDACKRLSVYKARQKKHLDVLTSDASNNRAILNANKYYVIHKINETRVLKTISNIDKKLSKINGVWKKHHKTLLKLSNNELINVKKSLSLQKQMVVKDVIPINNQINLTIDNKDVSFKYSYEDHKRIAKHVMETNRFRYIDHNNNKKNIFLEYFVNAKSVDDLKNYIREIHSKQQHCYKLNLVLSGIGSNIVDGKQQYILIHPSNYLNYFRGSPKMITKNSDLTSALDEITLDKMATILKNNGSNTSNTSILSIPMVFLKVTLLSERMGCAVKLPEFIKNCREIYAFNNVKNNLCFFHCMAKHLNPTMVVKRLNRTVKQLFIDYYGKDKNIKTFEGVELNSIFNICKHFKVNVKIFHLDGGDTKKDIKLFATSVGDNDCFKTTLNLFKHENHVMLINNVDTLLGRYQCKKCLSFFYDAKTLKTHIRNVKCQTYENPEQIDMFPDKPFWMPSKNKLKDLLIKYNIPTDYNLDNILTYDFESSTNTGVSKQDGKLKYDGQQVPMSYSICYKIGNKNSVTKTVLIDETDYDPIKLVKQFVNDVVDACSLSWKHYKKQFKTLFDQVRHNRKDLKIFLNAVSLPCLAHNANKFDIKLLCHFGFYQTLFKHKRWNTLLKYYNLNETSEQNSFIIEGKIVHVMLARFIDQLCFTPCSLDSFIKGFNPNAEIGKLAFPHETFDFNKHSDKTFNQINFPHSMFFSKLKNANISKDQYDELFVVAKDKNVVTMRDFLVLYNECDVKPFLDTCIIFRNKLRDISLNDAGEYVELYNECMGMPSFANKMMILFGEKKYREQFNKEWVLKPNNELILRIGFVSRKIRGYRQQDDKWNEEHKTSRKRATKISYDFCVNQYRKQGGKCYCCHKTVVCDNSESDDAFTLDRINNYFGHCDRNLLITCLACNRARKTGSIYSDAATRKEKAFYETYEKELVNLATKDDNEKHIFNQLKQKAIVGGPSMVFHRYHEINKTRIQHTVLGDDNKYKLGPEGNLVKYICSLDANSLYPWAYSGFIPCGRGRLVKDLSEDDQKRYIQNICDEDKLFENPEHSGASNYFGFVRCSMHIKREFYNKYIDCPLFYITKDIKSVKDDKETTSRKLSSYMECVDVVFGTQLFSWYMKQEGVVCDEIKELYLYDRGTPFKDFVLMGADKRRDKSNKIAGDLYKLMLNSSFGKTMQNNNNFSNTFFTTDIKRVNKAVNKNTFKDGCEYTCGDETVYIVSNSKKNVKQNMPIHVAGLIFSQAKLRMLQFYYDFVDKYIERKNFQYMYSDTDSIWMAYASENPFDLKSGLIKKGMEEQFEVEKYKYLVYTEYDVRTPGLFKVEYAASKLICLAAKSYFAEPGKGESKPKFGGKGIQMRNGLKMDDFSGALFEGKETVVTNMGFRFAHNKSLGFQKYSQTKRGVNSDYDKRGLLDNGINTFPLDPYNKLN